MYEQATVALPRDDAEAVTTYLTKSKQGEAGEVIVVEPGPEFPLGNAKVIFNGRTAVVSIAVPGKRAKRVLRLTDASITVPKRDGDPITISGTASELEEMGIPTEDAQTTLTIQSYSVCTTC